MSLANKKLKPAPVSPSSGKYVKVERQYGTLKRIFRAFEMDGGAENFAANVESFIFDDYGTKDGETTAPSNLQVTPAPKYVFPDCYLENQEIDKDRGNGASVFVNKVYQEAYDTIREIEKPQFATDENHRKTTRRTYVILNTAPDANKDLPSTVLSDVDDPEQVAIKQNSVEGNAVTIITRDFLQATETLEQVGGDTAEKDQNNKWSVTRDYIGLLAAPLGDEDVGTDTITYDGETLVLAGLTQSENATVKQVRKIWREKQILSVSTPKVGGQQRVQVQVLGLSEAEVVTAIAEVTANHKLIDVSKGSYEGYQATSYTFEVDDFETRARTDTNLLTIAVTELGTSNFPDGDVGTDTLVDDPGGANELTLYLSGEEIDNGNTIKRRVQRYAEPGQLSYGFSFDLDGLKTNRYRFLGVEGDTDGLIIDRNIGNWEGFQTIDVITQTKTDGTDFTDGGVVETFGVKYPFQYPGIAQCKFQATGADRGVYYLDLDPSITADVDATVEINYQTSSAIGTLPYTYWNPTSWAKFTAFWLTNNLEPTSVVKGLNGYRVGATSSQTYAGGLTQVAFLGRFVYAIAGYFATMSLTGGPSDPSGNTYVIARPKVEPAFVESDGTKWYKRTIIYATV